MSDNVKGQLKIGTLLEEFSYLDDTGTANAYAVAFAPAPAALNKIAFRMKIKAGNTNTGASTCSINGSAGIPITKDGGSALASGDLKAEQIYSFAYDGTSLQLVGGSGGGGGGTSGYSGYSGISSIGGSTTFTALTWVDQTDGWHQITWTHNRNSTDFDVTIWNESGTAEITTVKVLRPDANTVYLKVPSGQQFAGRAVMNGGAGQSGYSGYSGAGSSGYSGYSGSGVSGYSGYSGSGISGYSGYSGNSTSGYSGYSGAQGSSTSGYSGYSGSGVSGYSGYSGAGTVTYTNNSNIIFFIGDGLNAIQTGVHGSLEVSFGCTVVGWTVVSCDGGTPTTGAIQVDIWKDAYANYPPTVADTITGTDKPRIIATGNKGQSTALTGWQTTLASGSILYFNVDSVTSLKKVMVSLQIVKS